MSQRLSIRKGDEVLVISGAERGSQGKVLDINRDNLRARVEGVAMRKRHIRKTQEHPQGGVIEKESPIHISNLRVVCPKCNQPVRMVRKRSDDKTKQSHRVCKKCSEVVS